MANRIIVYRFQTNPNTNMAAATALRPFYANYQRQAIMGPTPFGMVTNMLTDNSAEEVYNALLDANIGNHFIVIQVDDTDTPVLTLSSTGESTVNTTRMPNGRMNNSVSINHAAIDRNKTPEQLAAELDGLIEKVGQTGRDSLTPTEMSRLDHLSQL